MTVNSISQYSNIAETIASLGSNITENKRKKETLANLFAGSFATMGANTTQTTTIENEIKELEELIETQQAKIYEYNKRIFLAQDKLADAKNKLDNTIANYVTSNEEAAQEERAQIQLITQKVIDSYAQGKIEKDKIAETIQSEVSAISVTHNFPQGAISSLQSEIQDNVDEITELLLQKSVANTQVATATSSLTLLNEMYQVQIMALGTTATSKGVNNEAVFTPEQEEMVEQWYGKYHSTATSGADQYSINNQQVQNIGVAIGIKTDNSYNLSLENQTSYDGSILQEMYDNGFTYKEAMTACKYIFGTSDKLFNYDSLTDIATIGIGHGTDAQTVMQSLKNQVATLWGKQVNVDSDGDIDDSDNIDASGDINDGGDIDTGGDIDGISDIDDDCDDDCDDDTEETIKIIDPIGWNDGNTTYTFILDRNNDGKFDGANEFLGAENGLEELKALDTNKDGIVDTDEFDAGNVLIMSTNTENKAFGFLTAKDAEIQNIDLRSNSLAEYENAHTNVNGNEVKATFNITLGNKTVRGYQSLDDSNYLKAVYGDRYGLNMASQINFTDTDNQEALDNIKNNNYVCADEIDDLKAKEAKALNSFKIKQTEAQQEVKMEKEELKQDLTNKINGAEVEADVIENELTEEAQNEEYEKREIETERESLTNRKTTLEELIDNLYNDNTEKSDEDETKTKKQEYQTELADVKLRLRALDVKYD